MDSVREKNPIEWQKMCQRFADRFNPKREQIDSAELRRRIRKSGDNRAWTFLKHGGPELMEQEAHLGKSWAKSLLGWIKPLQRAIVRREVKKWMIKGYEHRISEAEWSIVIARQKLRELGVRLIEPYPTWRIRVLEAKYLKELGTRR